jgi:hypothetical protein
VVEVDDVVDVEVLVVMTVSVFVSVWTWNTVEVVENVSVITGSVVVIVLVKKRVNVDTKPT